MTRPSFPRHIAAAAAALLALIVPLSVSGHALAGGSHQSVQTLPMNKTTIKSVLRVEVPPQLSVIMRRPAQEGLWEAGHGV